MIGSHATRRLAEVIGHAAVVGQLDVDAARAIEQWAVSVDPDFDVDAFRERVKTVVTTTIDRFQAAPWN